MCVGVCVGVCVCLSGCADVVPLYLPAGSSLVVRGRCDMLVSFDASLGLGLLAKLFCVIVIFLLFFCFCIHPLARPLLSVLFSSSDTSPLTASFCK